MLTRPDPKSDPKSKYVLKSALAKIAPMVRNKTGWNVWGFFIVSFLSFLPCVFTDQYRYTWSLLVFLGPSIYCYYRLRTFTHSPEAVNTLLKVLAILLPLAVFLNTICASHFFTYPNENSVLGFYLLFPIVPDPKPVPFEDYIFYAFGIFSVGIAYVWSMVEVFGRKLDLANPPSRPLLSLKLKPCLVWLVIMIAGLGLHQIFGSGKLPGYFVGMLSGPGLATLLFWYRAGERVYWKSYFFTLCWVIVISIFWEPLLALSDGWWGYQKDALIGIIVTEHLPLEEILFWCIAPTSTIIIYEAIRKSKPA